MNDADLGHLEQRDDNFVLVFTRRLAHPREKVWRAVTEPEHMKAWFPDEMVGERRAGAKLRFVVSYDEGDSFDGEMVVFDPPSVMELMWGTDRLRIELKPAGDGTLLTLSDTFSEHGKAARDAAGWHECLDFLARALDGGPPPKPGSRWAEVHPRYVEHFGPEAATVGPPAGWEPPA